MHAIILGLCSILSRGAGVPCPLMSAVVDLSCALSGHVGSTRCLLVLSFIFLYRLRPSSPMYLRGWGRVGALLGLGFSWHAELNRLILTPSYHCRHLTMILCAGALDPEMHWCVSQEIPPQSEIHFCTCIIYLSGLINILNLVFIEEKQHQS